MRRSKAFVVFGGLLTVLAASAIPARSRAAGKDPAPPIQPVAKAAARDLVLLPQARLDESPALAGLLRAGASPTPPGGDAACPAEMVEVEGDYCPFVEQRCLRWLDPATKLQCAEFDHTASSGQCFMKTEHQKFCIDRYEWPGTRSAPSRRSWLASWNEAKAACEGVGKRLCSDTEWTQACEGPKRQPYPYGGGYTRDSSACNVDKPYIWPSPERVYDPRTSAVELARLDQREPSGSRAACVSAYGVHDMVGNVDEWVVNVSQDGQPHKSGLKGGYWGPVRTRCRPMTTGHEETFRYYQVGFRCCGGTHEETSLKGAPLAAR